MTAKISNPTPQAPRCDEKCDELTVIIIGAWEMADVFNEWARQYAEDSESFGDILDENGNAVTDYGERATRMFRRIYYEVSGLYPPT